VVIDAGHGGKDPGTRGVSQLPEKTIVLAISNDVAQILRSRGASVTSTRTTDRFLELEERARIAQRAQADLFVSIHADAAQRASASGSTLYISRNASAASQKAARSIQNALIRAGIECRGIHRANFKVLVGHSRPAVLVECGFLTNSTDAARLNTPAYRSKVAQAIAAGIAEHLASR
jgi:N-acetylmuramoyl-L-alanine amidase